jgi:hypothetical protein
MMKSVTGTFKSPLCVTIVAVISGAFKSLLCVNIVAVIYGALNLHFAL